jgi:hypothetical protein
MNDMLQKHTVVPVSGFMYIGGKARGRDVRGDKMCGGGEVNCARSDNFCGFPHECSSLR